MADGLPNRTGVAIVFGTNFAGEQCAAFVLPSPYKVMALSLGKQSRDREGAEPSAC